VVNVGGGLLVGAVPVVEDRVRAVEALAREAFLPEEGAVGAAGDDVVLGGQLAQVHAVDHGGHVIAGAGRRSGGWHRSCWGKGDGAKERGIRKGWAGRRTEGPRDERCE